MIDQPCSDAICREMSGEMEDMARWLSGGGLSPEQFRLSLTELEGRKLQRFGLKMTSSVSASKIVHFTLRFVETGEFCSSMNVDPATGAMSVQHACALAPR
ncbi:MAG: hypothetical protein ABJF10_23725 [Chthoniobacter sp.]|uniref:hypothetical protein n=1 Tax=Chthoniobacter sp. TaxID=2510640 RepID=UPI0032A97FB2